jgi:hypothetical protein
VFKENVKQEEVDKYVSQLDSAGASSTFCDGLGMGAHSSCVSGGSVGQRYDGKIMNGFSATIPDSFMSQLQSLQSDGVIDYIGACSFLCLYLPSLTFCTLSEPDGKVTTQ